MIYQTSLTGCSYMYGGTVVMHMASSCGLRQQAFSDTANSFTLTSFTRLEAALGSKATQRRNSCSQTPLLTGADKSSYI